MITTKKKRFRALPRPLGFVFVGIMAVVLFALALGVYIRPYPSTAESAGAMPVATPTGDNLYLIVREGGSLDRVLAVDPSSGKVNQTFEAGYNSADKLTPDHHILYVFNEPLNRDRDGKGLLSATDLRTGTLLWKASLPGWPFIGSPTDGMWLSSDEKSLYLQATLDGFSLHIFTVDTQTGALVRDSALSLPYPSTSAFPMMWKLPWAEVLVGVAQDQIFTFDLASGQASRATSLVIDPQSLQRIPKTYPRGYFAMGGTLDPDNRQLILATAPQEVIAVKLDTQPFTIKKVFSLPTGWEFGGRRLLLSNPKEKALYVQVKRADTPILNGLEAEEVWTFDSVNGTLKSRLNLREQIANLTHGAASNVDLTNYGLFPSNDGRSVYALMPAGMLRLSHDPSGQLTGNWVPSTRF